MDSNQLREKARHIVEVANKLNAVTDEFSKEIIHLDSIFQSLNIGLEVWVELPTSEPKLFLGYQKINNRWGLAIHQNGSYWPFNDAPRMLRIKTITVLPDLLNRLTSETETALAQICDRINFIRNFMVTTGIPLTEVKQDAGALKNQ